MIDIVLFKGRREQAKGLIGMSPIPDKTFFVFPGIRAGALFHSRGVLEPFDIAFVDKGGRVLTAKRVVPSDGTAVAPPGTDRAVEAKAGTFQKLYGLGGSQFGDLGSISSPDIFFPTLIMLTAAGLGYYGVKNIKTTPGKLAVGAAGSLVSSALVFIFRKILFPPVEKA